MDNEERRDCAVASEDAGEGKSRKGDIRSKVNRKQKRVGELMLGLCDDIVTLVRQSILTWYSMVEMEF